MEIKIKDENFSMFSPDAKDALVDHVKNYTSSLKDESERLAAAHYDPDTEPKVSKRMVESMIGIHGFHVVRKPHWFYTYVLSVLEAFAGGLICNALFKDNKTTATELIMIGSIVFIVGSIILRHFHDTKN